MKSVIVTFDEKNNEFKAYSTLKLFVEENPQYAYDTINHKVSRKKEPYIAKDGLVITRLEVKKQVHKKK